MVDAPPPPSCTVLGSAVPAVKLSTQSVWDRRFVCPTALPQTPFPWNLLAWFTVQVPFSQIDMPICPLKSQIASSTGHLDQYALCGVLCSAAALQRRPPAALAAGCTSQNSVLVTPGAPPPGNLLVCGQYISIWKCGIHSPSELSLGAAILNCS